MDDDGAAEAFQRLTVCAGAEVDRPLAQLGCGVAQAREHQVQLLAVEPAAAEHPLGLDQHDLAVAVLGGTVEVRAELVTEDPQWGLVRIAGFSRSGMPAAT